MGVKCPKCQHENPDNLSFCGKCGTQLPSPEKVEVTETLETPKEELTRETTFVGSMIGRPEYMASEQEEGEVLNYQTSLFS